MITLGLDIDFVVVVAEKELHYLVKKHHKISNWFSLALSWNGMTEYKRVALINPEKLATLLEKSRKLGVNLMFLTSGCWDEMSFKTLLKNGLSLSPETQQWIDNSIFLATNNAEVYFPNAVPATISQIKKGERLARYEAHKNITDMKYVFLDDSPEHLKSLLSERVTCIHAKTHIKDVIGTECLEYTAFYDEAYAELEKWDKIEKRVLSQVNKIKKELFDSLKESASMPLIPWMQYGDILSQDATSFFLLVPGALLSTALLAGVGVLSFTGHLIWGGYALSKAAYADKKNDLPMSQSSELKINESTKLVLDRMPRTQQNSSETVSWGLDKPLNTAPSAMNQVEQSDNSCSL